MRFSIDQWKLKDGSIIIAFKAPKNAVLWRGYDYKNQYWIFEGKKDTRTLEEIKRSRKKLLKHLTIKNL